VRKAIAFYREAGFW